MTLYIPPSLKRFEPLHLAMSTWIDHLPFGYDIVEAVQPKLLVELGTYSGLSYFTFCQSVREHDLGTLCYAVDTWEGDPHTKAYEESVYNKVAQHNREHYHGFSYLMKMRFDQALDHFRDEAVDLLHIDGYHTYEAVKGDFEQWYPKVKPGGIILFHDTVARLKDFGVWRFWDEISTQYDAFNFIHGYGLGVIRKPGKPEKESQLEKLLFSRETGAAEKMRDFYVHASRFHDLKRKVGRGVFGKVRRPIPNKPDTDRKPAS